MYISAPSSIVFSAKLSGLLRVGEGTNIFSTLMRCCIRYAGVFVPLQIGTPVYKGGKKLLLAFSCIKARAYSVY